MSETLPTLATRTPADLIAWGRTAIEEAASFIAVKEIRDQAEALRAYQRSVGAAQEAVDAAHEIRVRAERRMGQEIDRAQRDGSAATPHRRKKGSPSVTLSEISVTKKQSSEWQRLAAVDDETFDAALATAREKGKLSLSAVRGLLRERRREAEAAEQKAEKRSKGLETKKPRGPPEEEAREQVSRLFQMTGRLHEFIGKFGEPGEVANISAKPVPKGYAGNTIFNPAQLYQIADFLTALAATEEERVAAGGWSPYASEASP